MIQLAYLSLEQRLRTVPELRQIDLYVGQLENSDLSAEETVHDLPAAFVEFRDLITSGSSYNSPERVEAQLSIHLYSFTADTAAQAFKTPTFRHQGLVDQVSHALRNYCLLYSDLFPGYPLPEGVGDYYIIQSMYRTAMLPISYMGSYMHTELRYKALLFDFATTDYYTSVQAALNTLISLEP